MLGCGDKIFLRSVFHALRAADYGVPLRTTAKLLEIDIGTP